MRDSTIARNYAETLLALARKANDLAGWGNMLAEISSTINGDERLRHFLEAPQISAEEKKQVLAKAFGDRVPRLFLRYLQALVDKRRQMLLREIVHEYGLLVDAVEGRVHAQVTIARPFSEADRALIAQQLSRTMGKTVVPHITVNPVILGGLVVRVGDTVLDGSLRKRFATLRSRLMTQIPG